MKKHTRDDWGYDVSKIQTIPAHADTFDEMLALLKTKSFLIGEQSVISLASFLNGFLFGSTEKESRKGHLRISEFSDWVHGRFVCGTEPWYQTIRLKSEGSSESLVLFWQLWEEFNTEHGKLEN